MLGIRAFERRISVPAAALFILIVVRRVYQVSAHHMSLQSVFCEPESIHLRVPLGRGRGWNVEADVEAEPEGMV
jgi:hypothetical protein